MNKGKVLGITLCDNHNVKEQLVIISQLID
jgi:hypothetical protein